MKAKAESVGEAMAHPWIREEVERYRDYLRAEKRSERTVEKYTGTLASFLGWYGKDPTTLTKQDLQLWKLDTSPRYCENSMSTFIAAINQYLERLLERPDLKMRPPRRVFREKVPLTEDEVRRMLDEAKKPALGRNGVKNNADTSSRDYAAICLMYFGGLRESEVTNLRISGMDLESRRVRVHEGKGNDNSLVNLNDEAVAALRNYLENGRAAPAKKEYTDYLFLSLAGKPLRRDKLWPMVKKVAFRAGIEKNAHPHLFRHSMITHMAEKGVPASFIQRVSRHRSLDMVQKYIHHSELSVRTMYDGVFSRSVEPAEAPASAQKTSSTSEAREPEPERESRRNAKSEPQDLRARIAQEYLEGRISEGKLDKLISILDGNVSRNDSEHAPTGYA